MNTFYKTLAFLVLLCAGQQAIAQDFITQWNLANATGSGSNQISFGIASSAPGLYTWEQLPSGASGAGTLSGATLTITGIPAGATIRLRIAPLNFQRIIINSGLDRNRLTLIEQWGTTAWTSMQRAFYDCQNLQIIATDVPNLSGVTNMSEMFSGCINLNSPSNIGSWNTSTVTDMNFMFYGATAFNQNISGWNTGAVTNMSTMFSEAAAFNQDIGAWNTGAVTDMSGMFDMASAFNQNISAWNTAATTDMSFMFSQATAFNQNIDGWNTGAVTDMRGIFFGASAFNQNIGAWTLNPIVDLRNIFDNSGMDCNNYSATLIGWSANATTPNGRQLGAVGRQYGTNAIAARTNLDVTKGWTITGDASSGTVCVPVPVPTIASFLPTSGPIGTSVIITGTNFSATPANNIVYFGATRATVTAANSTQLTVTVPTGATYQPISVLVNGLTGFSNRPFITTFADGGVMDVCSFAPKADITTGSDPYSVAIGDLDADGKPDLAVANEDGNSISVFKNISTLGSITSASFAAKVDFTAGSDPYFVMIHDVDGDGKPELIATSNTDDKVSVFKNNTTAGVINGSSFAAKIDFSTGQNPWIATVADFDRDGKPDLAIVNDVDDSFSILKNTSTTGVINASSFAPKVDFVTGSFPIGIASGDLDGDGKIDLVVTNQAGTSISVFRNTSTTGIINTSSFANKIDFTVEFDPYSVAIGDLDGDNKPEIAVANYSSGSVSVLGNISTVGTIGFLSRVDFNSGASSGTVSIADIDGDGKPDLNVTSGAEGISILKNVSVSTPIDATSFSPRINFSVPTPYGLAIADLDGNGKPDVVSTDDGGATASTLRNTISSLPAFTGGIFTPTSGPIGTVVTITGTDFSTTPLNNTVKFNGVVATVTASTSTSITTSVPMGATTGSIGIEIGCVNAFTIVPFTVTAGATITVTQQPLNPNNRCEGLNFTFSTDATGTTNITYQWQKFNVVTSVFDNLADNSTYSGTNTKNLLITNVQAAQAGDYRCLIQGDFATPVFCNIGTLTVNPTPTPPTVTAGSTCGIGQVTLSASGAADGDFIWYGSNGMSEPISGENNSTYTTPSLTATTNYYVSIVNAFCESSLVPVTSTVVSNSAPMASGVSVCSGNTATLTASGGTNGQYRWYTVANGGTAISGQTNSTFITPGVSVVTTFYVSLNNGSCESSRTAVVVTPISSACAPPSITPSTILITIGGNESLDLKTWITTPSGTLDVNSISVTVPPPSGAIATVVNGVLTLDYKGIAFAGRETVTVRACDTFGNCSTEQIEIDVTGDLNIYTGISPNGDIFNEVWLIQNIEILDETKSNKVSIYNRWGDVVWEVENYENKDRVFKGLNKNGNELPSGTYFYKIEFGSGRKSETGYLSLKR